MTRQTHNHTETAAASETERYLRTDFLRALAHGLRSPLTVARGALAELPGSSPEDVEFLSGMAQRSLTRLTRLAEQLDWLSELSTVSTTLSREPCEPSALLSEAARATDLSKLQVKDAFADNLPKLSIDRSLMLRALGAMLDNARRFAKQQVLLSATEAADAVVLTIEDDGPGIAQERWHILFNPYIPAKQRGADTDLALGLPLSQTYVQLHGGEIVLDKSPLGGLLCRIRLPKELVQGQS